MIDAKQVVQWARDDTKNALISFTDKEIDLLYGYGHTRVKILEDVEIMYLNKYCDYKAGFKTIKADSAGECIRLVFSGYRLEKPANRYIDNLVARCAERQKDNTVDGYVYFLLAEEVNLMKVGFQRSINSRTDKVHSHCPYDLTLYARVPAVGGIRHERRMHDRLTSSGHHHNREWFIWDEDSKAIIDQEITTLPLTTPNHP